MNVNLSQKMQAFVDAKVSSGQYASADEVIDAALEELQNLETGELEARWLKAKLEAGRMSLELDGGLTPEQVKQRMMRIRERYLSPAKP